MTDVPLRSIAISDFRRLEGHRVLPLDAPIVLLHGPNGAGKTSVLSALELALTGEIRSMRRQDPRYTAHLPFQGQNFATLSVMVSQELAVGAEAFTMTVGGSRIEGSPALSDDAGQFFAERCYLDQVSLGQLLELYQFREGREESALARFVNELLGLEQLDALRTGLSDAADLRKLKRLSEPLADADAEVQHLNSELPRVTTELESVRQDLTRTREELTEAVATLGRSIQELNDEDVDERVEELLGTGPPENDAVVELNRLVTALGGRIEMLAQRPAIRRLEDARSALRVISAEVNRWTEEHSSTIAAWRADTAFLELGRSGDEAEALDEEILRIGQSIAAQRERVNRTTQLENELAQHRSELRAVQEEVAETQEQVGSLVEALGTLREHATDNMCPVCDRNFAEVGTTHLADHIDWKISNLTNQGVRLRELRAQRNTLVVRVQGEEHRLESLRAELWAEDQRQSVSARESALMELRERLQSLQPIIAAGRVLDRRRHQAARELEELEAFARDAEVARSDLEELALALNAPPLEGAQALEDAWNEVARVAAEQLEQHLASQRAHDHAKALLGRHREIAGRVGHLRETVAELAERKVGLEQRVREARRRQAVARAVHNAASTARSTIVQRVFTESLNEVWQSVFTRLAPREPFVPAFGVPTSAGATLDLVLETVHTSGDSGGAPQMMLSAGNLNTAALSLFIALHLAVEPLVPCLVFDDPVQSMDEVHVAQFAGLMRVLSKYHGRQVVIAVHERELFQYLALELSPAFEGDELITIELGPGYANAEPGIARLTWTSDEAIAV